MQTSQNGIDLIKKFEGFSAEPYYCSAGKLTIGYGHVITREDNVGVSSNISPENAEKLLRKDIILAEHAVTDFVKVPITQNQFDALVSFVFNIGVSAFQNSTLLKMININEPVLASKEFARWVYAGGKVQKGLIKRREHEKQLFLVKR